MTMGAGIDYSTAVIGATTNTLSKIGDGKYSVDRTSNSAVAPIVFTVQPAVPGSPTRRITAQLRYNPSINNGPTVAPRGKFVFNIDVTVTPGLDVTLAEMQSDWLPRFCSILLKSTLFQDLLKGSSE